jgi:hypothetical protein
MGAMSFESTVMRIVDRLMVVGRKRTARKHPEQLPEVDQAIADVRARHP